MPNIYVRVAKWYDWEVVKDATEEELESGLLRQNVSGDYTKKVIHDEPSTTHVSLPEAEIQDCMEHFERVDRPKTREQTIAWYLEEQTMPLHARQSDWLGIAVPDEPELETYLKSRYNLKGEPIAPVEEG